MKNSKEYQRNWEAKNKDKRKLWKINNKDKVKIVQDRYNLKNKDKIKERRLIRDYNINNEQYDNLLSKQNNSCAICSTHQSKLRRSLSVDHNHKTNQVRGLLCDNCNLVLGHAFDSVTLLDKAIKYLQKYTTKNGEKEL